MVEEPHLHHASCRTMPHVVRPSTTMPLLVASDLSSNALTQAPPGLFEGLSALHTL